MALHTRIYNWGTRRFFVVDIIIAALTVLPSLTVIFEASVALHDLALVRGAALTIVIAAVFAFRRKAPNVSGLTQLGLFVLAALPTLAPTAALGLAPFILYTLTVYGRRWAGILALLTGFAGAVVFARKYVLYTGGPFAEQAVMALALALVMMLAWLLGDLTRMRRRALQGLREHAARLEKEREQERRLAILDERAHIAREMHDIVAHSLSVIITQADGARYAVGQKPELAAPTLATISATGRDSLREMRRLLGVLRSDEESETRPLPGLDNLDGLVATARTAGLDTHLGITGTRRRALPTGAELSAYRAVQEALTNSIRHAGKGTRAWVQLDWSARGLRITVDDDGVGAASGLDSLGAGHGLAGMRERIGLYDGSVQAGARHEGGYRVTVFIPYDER